MRQILTVALASLASLIALIGLPAEALAAKRVALIIGNSAYKSAGELPNPKNDATDISVVFKRLGIEVIEGIDLDKAAFDRKIRDFATALQGADVGVFFYSGHGLQVGGQNYLVPVDAQLSSAAALDFEMVRLDLVHRTMEREAQTNIIFLDACRNNPLERNLRRAMGTRSAEIGRGLAAVESGIGSLISFSTQPGNVALDGSGHNSPFASALIKQLSTSTDDLSGMLIAVRNDVMKETHNKQIPWEHSALTDRFYFSSPAEKTASLPTGARPAGYTGETAGGLFTRADAERVRMLAEKHKLSLPVFQIEVPDADVPAHLRRFIGAWIGVSGSYRTNMMIATRVSKDGKLDGYWTWGPPGTNSRFTYPGGMFQIAGTITGNTLRYTSPSGDANYQLTLTSSNKMNYVYSSTAGDAIALVFDPVWTLVRAEQAAKK
jgi:hypothetical protein